MKFKLIHIYFRVGRNPNSHEHGPSSLCGRRQLVSVLLKLLVYKTEKYKCATVFNSKIILHAKITQKRACDVHT